MYMYEEIFLASTMLALNTPVVISIYDIYALLFSIITQAI